MGCINRRHNFNDVSVNISEIISHIFIDIHTIYPCNIYGKIGLYLWVYNMVSLKNYLTILDQSDLATIEILVQRIHPSLLTSLYTPNTYCRIPTYPVFMTPILRIEYFYTDRVCHYVDPLL